jgi:hypothetical protein
MKTTYISSNISTKEPVKTIPELQWIESLAHVMDNAFRIPGTNIRFGLDPIIGLIPAAGELMTFGISGLMVMIMARRGVSRKVLLMMAGNVLLDSIVGSVPFIGDLFDLGFKANQRNLSLLKKHYHEGKHQGSGIGLIIIVALVLLACLALLIFGIWKLGGYIKDLF